MPANPPMLPSLDDVHRFMAAVWICYRVPELGLPFVIALAHRMSTRREAMRLEPAH